MCLCLDNADQRTKTVPPGALNLEKLLSHCSYRSRVWRVCHLDVKMPAAQWTCRWVLVQGCKSEMLLCGMIASLQTAVVTFFCISREVSGAKRSYVIIIRKSLQLGKFLYLPDYKPVSIICYAFNFSEQVEK